jgi:hypothetical protein
MLIKGIKDLIKEKRNDIAVLVGSGSSVNDITAEQWKKILSYDFWTMNNWVYMPTVPPSCSFSVSPRFYYLEVKVYGKDAVNKHFQDKWDNYKNTNFITPQRRVGFIFEVVGHDDARFFSYEFIKRDVVRKDKTDTNADYDPSKPQLVKSYDASTTLLIDMLYKFGYKKIFLFGFDMHDSKYFWSDHPEFGIVHHRFNKAHESGKMPDHPHSASHVKNFIVDFNKRHMLPVGRKIVVGNKNTSLYPELDFEQI